MVRRESVRHARGFAGFACSLAVKSGTLLKPAAVGVVGIGFTPVILVSPPGFLGIFGGLELLLAVIALEVGGRALTFERASLVGLGKPVSLGVLFVAVVFVDPLTERFRLIRFGSAGIRCAGNRKQDQQAEDGGGVFQRFSRVSSSSGSGTAPRSRACW